MKAAVLSLVAAAGLASPAFSQTLVPLNSFGTAGWRAPGVVLAGDAAGTATGSTYNFLGTGNNERGMAYNPATGNLILVSRNGGPNVRVLSGVTGVDTAGLNLGVGVITGGTFVVNKVGVSGDGAIYVANLTTDIRSSAYKVYRWDNEAASPATHYNALSAFGAGGTAPRLGDSLDATGSGVSTKLAAGFAGIQGLVTITGNAGGTSQIYTGTVTPTPPAGALGFTGVAAGEFRLGLTFAQDDNNIWGKQTSSNIRRAALSGTGGASLGTSAITSAGESPMDYATIGGVAYLAAIDVNNSRVYVYDLTNPAAPVSLFPFGLTTTTGTLTGNGNGTGDVKWGAIDNLNQTATLYAMSSNQGIQAFTFTVPAPTSGGLLAMAGLLAARRRRR